MSSGEGQRHAGGHLVTGGDGLKFLDGLIDKPMHHPPPEPPAPRPTGLDWDAHRAPASKATRTAATDLVMIPVDLIDPNPGNIREDLGDVSELAASIVQNGLVQPLVVYAVDDRYRLIAGHRRLAACQEAALDAVPCVVRRHPSRIETLRLMLVENLQRTNLDPIEEARAIASLMDVADCSQAVAGKMIGKSQGAISARLKLLDLTPAEQAQVRSRELLVRDAHLLSRARKGTLDRTQFTGWHFGKTHRLAELVRLTCRANSHTKSRKVGGVGCGECWEQVIRESERQRLSEETAS